MFLFLVWKVWECLEIEVVGLGVYDIERLEGKKDPDVETVGIEDLEDRDEIVEALHFYSFYYIYYWLMCI